VHPPKKKKQGQEKKQPAKNFYCEENKPNFTKMNTATTTTDNKTAKKTPQTVNAHDDREREKEKVEGEAK
jgi:hypothetical protein